MRPADRDIAEQVDVLEAIGGEASATKPICDGATPGDGRASAIGDDGERLRSGRLAGLTIWGAIFVLSWPILLEALMQSLVGLVDTMLSAGLSEAAADAVGAAAYVTWFLTLVGMAIGVGATALVSRSIGKGRQAVANAAVGQAMLLSAVSGLAIGAVVALVAPEVARMLQLGEEAASALVTYLRIGAIGVVAVTVLTSGFACCRGAGDAKRPLATMVVVNIVNIIVSWALSGVDIGVTHVSATGEAMTKTLIANPFHFDMGVAGIAIGTLCAWLVGALIVIALLVRGSSGVQLRARRLRLHKQTMRRLVRVGLPNFFETFGMWFGNFLTLLLVGWMATPGLLGAHIVAIRVEAFSFLPGFSMGMAAATLAGQYLGAGRPDLARRAMRRCMMVASVLMGVFGVVFMTAPTMIVGLFTPQQIHLEIAPRLLQIAGAVQIPFAIMLVLRTGMRGAGDTRVAMTLTWTSTYLIRLPAAWLLSGVDIPLPPWLGGGVIPNPSPVALGLPGMWMGLCGEIVVRAMLFSARFIHGGWLRVSV